MANWPNQETKKMGSHPAGKRKGLQLVLSRNEEDGFSLQQETERAGSHPATKGKNGEGGIRTGSSRPTLCTSLFTAKGSQIQGLRFSRKPTVFARFFTVIYSILRATLVTTFMGKCGKDREVLE